MTDDPKRILFPFTERKKQKAWNKTGGKYVLKERKQNLPKTDRGSLELKAKEFLDDKSAFYNGSEGDDSDNNDENYNKNNEDKQLSEGFTNDYYKINPPILLQKLINDFVIWMLCGGTLLLVKDVANSHSFVRIWNFTCEKENCLSNSLKIRPISPQGNRYFEINRAVVFAFYYISHSGAKRSASILKILLTFIALINLVISLVYTVCSRNE